MKGPPVHGGYPGNPRVEAADEDLDVAGRTRLLDRIREMLAFIEEECLPLPNGCSVDFNEFFIYVYDRGEFDDLVQRFRAERVGVTYQRIGGAETATSIRAQRVFGGVGAPAQDAKLVIHYEACPSA